jgi:pimeloyl-ACP methyl ester carboxylesterase
MRAMSNPEREAEHRVCHRIDVLVPQASHILLTDQPERVNQTILEFLSAV